MAWHRRSSDGWNNAGTGHAGICELSYTPKREADGSVKVAKVIEIFEQFEQSKHFWSYAVANDMASHPREFINPVPHISFVHGADQVEFLKARHAGMSAHHFFREMVFTTDRTTLASWAPLLVDGRGDEPIAATKMDGGTDVNFGAISRKLLSWLGRQEGCGIASGHRVIGLRRDGTGWEVRVKESATGLVRTNRAKFVFVGAGGGTLPLLQMSGIPEAKGLGGFPIGGQWLICDNPEIVEKHQAKVYGQALAAAPTMAVPHLDTRILDGRKTLLFGPFAAWTTKFLHQQGRYTDLPFSIRPDNLSTLVNIGIHNLDLVRYLIQQGTQSMRNRIEVLKIFYPAAQAADWKLNRRRHSGAGHQEDGWSGRHCPLRHRGHHRCRLQHLRAARSLAWRLGLGKRCARGHQEMLPRLARQPRGACADEGDDPDLRPGYQAA
ncbi:probable malate:quinone oxidoreductase 2 [Opitutia bacterium]|nr:probable malate:quinone oxidoreductase 2 [Opitutae bacterium]